MLILSVKETLKATEVSKTLPKPMPKILVNGMAQEVDIPKPITPEEDTIELEETPNLPEQPTGLLHDLEAELKDLELKRNKLSSSIYYQVYGKTTPTSIEISEVLSRLNRTYDETNLQQRTFGIRALTANGQTELLNCRKKIIDKKREVSNSEFKHNLKQHGNIMLIREDSQTRTIKVCAIYEFKDHNSKIWTRVRH